MKHCRVGAMTQSEGLTKGFDFRHAESCITQLWHAQLSLLISVTRYLFTELVAKQSVSWYFLNCMYHVSICTACISASGRGS